MDMLRSYRVDQVRAERERERHDQPEQCLAHVRPRVEVLRSEISHGPGSLGKSRGGATLIPVCLPTATKDCGRSRVRPIPDSGTGLSRMPGSLPELIHEGRDLSHERLLVAMPLSDNCRANHCLATCQKDPVTCSRDRRGHQAAGRIAACAMMSALTCGLDAR